MSYLKGEFNFVQTIKLLAIFLGGTLITFGVLKMAYWTKKIYDLLLNKL